jgi:IS5 family transposase
MVFFDPELELQRQIDCRGLEIKKGMIQDATFIVAEPGHANQDKLRGDEAKTRRSRDGNWSKKGGKSYFGYKLLRLLIRRMS